MADSTSPSRIYGAADPERPPPPANGLRGEGAATHPPPRERSRSDFDGSTTTVFESSGTAAAETGRRMREDNPVSGSADGDPIRDAGINPNRDRAHDSI